MKKSVVANASLPTDFALGHEGPSRGLTGPSVSPPHARVPRRRRRRRGRNKERGDVYTYISIYRKWMGEMESARFYCCDGL